MPYFVIESEPSKQLRGPYKTLTEARKKAANAKFADGGDIYKDTKLIGQVGQGYDGRWFKTYVDLNTRKEYYLKKDGTLGRRY